MNLNCASCGLGEAGKLARRILAPRTREEFRYEVPFAIPALVGSRQTVNIVTQSDSYFVVQKITSVQAGDFLCRISETGNGVLLMDDFIRQANLFGTIQLPNVVIDPLVIPPSSQINFELINNIAGANAGEIVLTGYKHYDLSNPPQFINPAVGRILGGKIQWFQYSLSQALLANAQGTFQIRIQSDSNFIVRKLVAISTGNFQTRISDTGTKSLWSNTFTQQNNTFGVVGFPAILTTPRLVQKNSTIQVDLQDLSAAPNTVQLVFEGVKQYLK